MIDDGASEDAVVLAFTPSYRPGRIHDDVSEVTSQIMVDAGAADAANLTSAYLHADLDAGLTTCARAAAVGAALLTNLSVGQRSLRDFLG